MELTILTNYLDYLHRQFHVKIGVLYFENNKAKLLNSNEFYNQKIKNYLSLKQINIVLL